MKWFGSFNDKFLANYKMSAVPVIHEMIKDVLFFYASNNNLIYHK